MKPTAMIIGLLDRATAPSRRRHGEAIYWSGSVGGGDAFLSRLFFEVSAAEWARRGVTEEHLAPFVAGLERCRHPRSVLDLGTGPGATAAAVVARFPDAQVVGVDSSRRMVRIARRLHPEPGISVVRGDARQLPFEASRFDLICMLNANPDFPELARVATPDAEALYANTYFALPDSRWLRPWESAGWSRAHAKNLADGHWQLFRRTAVSVDVPDS